MNFRVATALALATASTCGILAGCSSSPGQSAAGASVAAPGATPASTDTVKSSSKSVNLCSSVSAADLSQAVGVTYTKSNGDDHLCNVTGAAITDTFVYNVNKEGGDGAINTWDSEVAVIKRDDGSITTVSGIGDRAVQGAVKEFGVESKGYIVTVINADFNNPPTAQDFTRSKKIAQFLISKL